MSLRKDQERQLVSSMQGAYGELLSLFLLSGLGEEAWEGPSYFTACELGPDEKIHRHRLAMTSGGDAFLPHGRDPLVLAALLRLVQGLEGSHRVKCPTADLTALLGWEDMAGAGQAIASAIERYYAASLAVLAPSEEPYFGEWPAFTFSQRILIEYVTADGEGDGRTYVSAVFNPDFVARLRSKSLLGIDWSRVVAIEV